METIVVLGAGPAGITAARALASAGKKVVVLEKAPRVGGMASTFKKGDYLLDYGPHAFHIKEEYITALVKDVCKDDFRVIPTNTYVYLKGKYFKYPLELYNVLTRLNPLLSARMLFDYAVSFIKGKVNSNNKVTSFKDWGIKYFGKTLYNLCFGDYTERVWGMSAELLSYKLAQQKLSKLNLGDIIRKLVGGKGEEQKAYFKSFIYPRGGVGTIFRNMAAQILNLGGEIHLDASVKEIRVDRGKREATEILYQSEGSEKLLKCSAIISSIPLGTLAKLITPPLNRKALKSASKLRFRDLILIYLIVDKSRVTDFQWVYLLDEFAFNRLAEQKNMSPDMLPKDKTALSFEVCCNEGDALWRTDDEELFKTAQKELNRLDLLKSKEISEYFVIRLKNAYPIYDLNFDQEVDSTIAELSGVTNLLSIGRNGLFLNNDIHDSIEMALIAADFMLAENWNSQKWYEQMRRYVQQKIEG